jgi:hypothetical protein
MYRTGVFIDGASGKFSRGKVGPIVDDYLVNTGKLSPRRWKHILDACEPPSEELDPPLDSPVMQVDRRRLYVPSSPIQVSDSD